ncbi:LOG family protein, partial [Candidatus Berkelbacteria bacterium]|nr:LOG family protein [Candidatus Berkelbacteria bacterium]
EGAKAAKADSIGINIQLPTEQRINPYVTKSEAFEHFFTRKVMLSYASQVYIFFPGGFGTLDELFEMLTLIQTHKIEGCERNDSVGCIPVVLFGTDYWQPLCDWLKQTVLNKFQSIDESDLNLWTLTNDLDQVVEIAKKSPGRHHHINSVNHD